MPVSQGILLTEFWVLDSTTPAQLEEQILSNSIRFPSDISPFRVEASRAPAHLGLSTSADRRAKGNDNFSGATSRPSPIPSTARGRSDVALLGATNLTTVTPPASDLPSMVSVSSPPAYEAIPAHCCSAFPSQ